MSDSRYSVEDFIQFELESRPHEWCDWTELIMRIVHDETLEGSFVGSYSLTTRDRSHTFVSTAHRWCGRPVSASSIARRILNHGLELIGRKRILWQKRCFKYLDLPQPLYCEPTQKLDYLIYVDISSCYYQLYRRLPFELFWFGLHPICGDIRFDDFLPSDITQYKLCRNSVVGVLRSTSGAVVSKGKISPRKTRNALLSPCHWGIMSNLLHHFAGMARDLGCIYYNTDGAIFTSDYAACDWALKMSDLGFSTNIKARGIGWVKGIGCYGIGNEGGRNHMRNGRHFSNLFDCNYYALDLWKKLL